MNVTLKARIVPLPCASRTSLLRCSAQKHSSRGFVDYYDLLHVDADATVEEIKFNFRRLQKQYHPDISGQEETSSVLNQAYETLIDPQSRRSYDHRLASVPLTQRQWKRSFKDQPGIVGPLTDAEIVMQRTIFEGDDTASRDEKIRENVVWLREWAKTFIFAADLPLPLPLQCDEIENGVRLAFITTSKNRIRSAGELHFVIEEKRQQESATTEPSPPLLYLSVYRVIPSHSYDAAIPGEFNVMKAFSRALQDKEEIHDQHHHHHHGRHHFLGFELSGFAASAAAQFMPVLVTIPVEKTRGSSYEAYHLKHPSSN